MKKILLAFSMLLALSATSVAQQTAVGAQEPFQGVDGIVKKEHIAKKKCIPYAYVREADVLWSKTVWRIIDLREKINLPLFYPTAPMDNRMNLISVIEKALQVREFDCWRPGYDDEFTVRMQPGEWQKALGASIDTVQQEDPETHEIRQVVLSNEFNPAEIKQVMLKEVWYFDKKHTRMDVRIIALCPIRESMNSEGTRLDKTLTFWIYFPELRPFLAKQEVFNTKNDAMRESFDDIFAKRRFGSYIYKEANVYNNRAITDYSAGMETTLEAERIKQDLFLKEHDMWEF